MNENLLELIDESIRLELQVAELYIFFSKTFDDDKKFWWKLALEEKNHASLLRGARDLLQEVDMFPAEILAENTQAVRQTNEFLATILNSYGFQPPSRGEAFRTAYFVEQSAGEMHYQEAMEKHADSTCLRIFQNLNETDRDHADRIRERMILAEISLNTPVEEKIAAC